MDKIDPENTLIAQWVIDSETGDQVLICCRTHEEITRKRLKKDGTYETGD